jgi:hypothetical protein
MDSHNNSHGAIIHFNNRHINLFCVLVFLSTVVAVGSVQAQEPDQQALSNIELEYTYSDLGTVVLRIDEGKLGYTWTEGPGAGNAVTDLIYRSRKIADEVYLVNWNDSDNSDYVVLVIDLDEMVVHGSALSEYRSEQPFAFFGKAKIARVDQ